MTKRLPLRATKIGKIDPKQDLFSALYFSPRLNGKNNPLFANAYQCALKAGYSDGVARTMTAASANRKWLQEAYQRLVSFKPEHTIKQLEDIALNATFERDRLRALEMIGKIQGIFIDRQQTEVNVTFTNSVPRPRRDFIDVELDGVSEAIINK